jgi:AcrR family transcriptional regulator
MARAIPAGRFSQLVDIATKTFISRGYRLTQMADIAAALGVAKGTLYGYVESKDALFDAAVRYADGHGVPPARSELPLPTPAQGATLAYIRERIQLEAADMALVSVSTGKLVIRNAERELETVLGDLYRRMAKNRLAVKLVDRCAIDYPELASVWFGEGRWAQHQLLVELIKTRAKKKRFRPIDNPEVIARAILEMVAFWAVHRHFDPSPQTVDDASAERAVTDLLVHGLLESP